MSIDFRKFDIQYPPIDHHCVRLQRLICTFLSIRNEYTSRYIDQEDPIDSPSRSLLNDWEDSIKILFINRLNASGYFCSLSQYITNFRVELMICGRSHIIIRKTLIKTEENRWKLQFLIHTRHQLTDNIWLPIDNADSALVGA